MKRTIKLLTVTAMLAAFAVPALAQSKECNDENKAAWYDTFLKNRNGEGPQQKVAYDTAKQYLTSCPDDPADQIAQYLKKWVAAYEKGNRKIQFEDAFNKKDYAKATEIGKGLLAEDPNNVRVYMLIGYGGYLASAAPNATMTPEAVDYAKKAIEMIESGKSPESWSPFTSRDQALAWLNYSIGKAKLANSPAEALPYLIKAARYDSELKKTPATYTDILTAYEKGPRAKLTEDYEAKYKGKPETPESKLAAANIDQIIDREIDAYARLAALTTNAADKKAVMDELTELYKYRNKSETGLNELLASVLSKPLPDVPAPITSLPTAPSSSPANNGSPGTNGGSQPGTSGGVKPANNATSTTGQNRTGSTAVTGTQTGKTNGTAKPAPSPAPANKPKPRRAHHHP
jgi:tetratricopeptide (TPR) repeat protein